MRVRGGMAFAAVCVAAGWMHSEGVHAEEASVVADAAAVVSGPAASPSLAPLPEQGLRLSLMTPRDDSSVGGDESRVFVAGKALTFSGRKELYDLVVLIDTSRSTAAPTGADIDGDGWVGSGREGRWIEVKSDDWGDTVLAAQIYATRALLQQLDPTTTRVGIVTFAGDDDPETPDAVRLAPLTSDFTHLYEVLDYLLLHRPAGHTHIAAALYAAAEEILGVGRSRPRPEATPVILLMTDGQPTRPYLSSEENAKHTLEMGKLVASRGIRIDPFPIGEGANQDTSVMQGLADLSGGRLTPVVQPSELLATFENLELAQLVGLEIVNRTTSERADRILLQADGTFAALVHVRDGQNRIEILARDSEGRRAFRSVTVSRLADGKAPALSPRLARKHTGILKVRLLELLQQEMAAEQARQLERERERSVQVEVDPGRDREDR